MSFTIRKHSNPQKSHCFTIFKLNAKLQNFEEGKITNEDETRSMNLRQKSKEDILAEEEETNNIMTGDQEAAIQRAKDIANARRPKKEKEPEAAEGEEKKEEEPEIQLPDEWFLESDKKSYRGFVETDNSASDSKYVLMVCKENNGEREFIVMDVHDKWYKFEPQIRKKQTLTAVELEKQRKENLKKVNQKLNKLDFVKAAVQRAKQEEKAQVEIDKEVKTEQPENMDYDDNWSDDEGYVAPDLDRDEKIDQDKEALIEYFDDLDDVRDEDDTGETGDLLKAGYQYEKVKEELDDDEHVLDKKSKKRKADTTLTKPGKKRRISGSNSMTDQLQELIERNGGKVKLQHVIKTLIMECPDGERDSRKKAVLAAIKEIGLTRTEGTTKYVVLRHK